MSAGKPLERAPMVSPRRRDNELTYSPEPKVMDFPVGDHDSNEFDSARNKNVAMAYPQNINKRHARVVKGSLGAVNIEDRAAVEYFMH